MGTQSELDRAKNGVGLHRRSTCAYVYRGSSITCKRRNFLRWKDWPHQLATVSGSFSSWRKRRSSVEKQRHWNARGPYRLNKSCSNIEGGQLPLPSAKLLLLTAPDQWYKEIRKTAPVSLPHYTLLVIVELEKSPHVYTSTELNHSTPSFFPPPIYVPFLPWSSAVRKPYTQTSQYQALSSARCLVTKKDPNTTPLERHLKAKRHCSWCGQGRSARSRCNTTVKEGPHRRRKYYRRNTALSETQRTNQPASPERDQQ